MKRLGLAAPALALIAACSGASTSIQPGQWETTTRMTSIDMPGAPPAMLAQVRAQLANQAQTQSSCITPEQAANPAGSMLNTGSGASACQFTDSTFAGGVIRVNGSCPGPAGASMRMSLVGSYTATTMEGRISSDIQGGPQSMRMSGTLTSRRTGDCPAG